MPRSRLPPLNALKAFDAVVRHMSFSQAAQELCVTPAALSYQIKQLEDFLDIKLFKRLNRSIALTAHGRLLYPGIQQAFEQLSQTMQLLQRKKNGDVLVISAGPAFVAKWLTPRLYRFIAKHPEIDARIASSLTLSNLKIDDVDVAIRFGGGNYPDYHVTKLFDDYVGPMCSPAYLEKLQPISVEKMLNNAVLIHDDMHIGQKFTVASWQDWFKHMGVNRYQPKVKGLHFDLADNSISAAVAGTGVALGREVLAQDDLAANRLVMPFEHKLKLEFSYYALCLKSRAHEPHIQAFLDWLEDEITGNIDQETPMPMF